MIGQGVKNRFQDMKTKTKLLVSFGLNQRDESVTIKPNDSLPNPTGDDIAIELQSTSR